MNGSYNRFPNKVNLKKMVTICMQALDGFECWSLLDNFQEDKGCSRVGFIIFCGPL